MRAATENRVSMVRILLEFEDADPAAVNEAGSTALHEAAGSGRLQVVRLLLDAGANPGAKDREGRTPMTRARDEGHEEVVGLLSRATEGPD